MPEQIVSGSGTQNPLVVDSRGNIYQDELRFTQKLAYNGGMVEYQGWAEPGNANSGSAVWRICKLTYDGTSVTDIKWAAGSTDFSLVWDSRAGYSYM
jgi:hypothetical protein